MLRAIFFIVLSTFITTLNLAQHPEPIGPFFGMTKTETPKILAMGHITSSLDEYNGTFNPTGTEFFFTTNTPREGIICYTKMKEDKSWSEVKVAPFSGEYSEYDPLFSPDGNRLYFSSERPISDTIMDGTNVWYVEKSNGAWTTPQYVDLTKDGDYYSSITNDGKIYFNVWDNGDLFKATPSKDGYIIEKLDSILNSSKGEGDPFIAPDESYIIYRGYNNSLGRGDLYISFNINNKWTSPENLGAPINSDKHEMCPYVTTDGKFFIFASSRMESAYTPIPDQSIQVVREQHQTWNNGQLNIYYISADFISKLREKYN